MTQKQEWQVRYKRMGWAGETRRVYQGKSFADRCVRKLRGHDRPDLAPIEYIIVSVREVGEWVQR